jgi:segregation and condensation protein B
MLEKQKIKSIIESLLFINEKSIGVEELKQVIEIDKKEIEKYIEELSQEYQRRNAGICIVKVAGGYQMCSLPDNEPWIKKMYKEKYKYKLSSASLETLAIIAYKQPITRMEIEAIRGVNIDGVIKHLLDLGLIKIAGRKKVIGRPFMYTTTRKFLEYFGLNSLDDLPNLEEFVGLAKKEE